MNNEIEFFEELTREVASQNITNATKLNNLKISLAKKHKLKRIIKDAEIIAHSPTNIRSKIISLMNIKPTRMASGVTVVALFAKPHKCPHGKCIYCPGGIGSEFGDTPQSYTGAEPAALRAIRNNYDPYLQIFNRLEHYVVNGHFPDKLELIFMGGTFPSLDKKYRDEFVYYTYKAINDFAAEFVVLDEKGNKIIDYDKFNSFFETGGDFQSKDRERNILKKVTDLRNKRRLRIGVDIDEVLAELLDSFLNRYNEEFNTKHNVDEFKSYDWSTVLSHSLPELIEMIYRYDDTGLYEKLKLVEDSVSVLKNISKDNDLYVITARPIRFKESTLKWLNENFGDIFEDIIFSSNHYSGDCMNYSKAGFCELMNMDLLIEDDVKYAKETSEKNVDVLLFDRSWNRNFEFGDNVVRVKSWKEIEKQIDKFKKNIDYKSEILKSQKNLIRPIGLTIETKPDWALQEHLLEMLDYGATRLEIGVQSLNDEILKKVGRGHGIDEVKESFEVAKDMCFKINAHMMVGLPYSSEKEDLKSLVDLYEDSRFRPDMIKIYPCLVTRGTQLYDMFEGGIYKQTDTKMAAKIIAKAFKFFPRYTRVMRVQRDIPTPNIIGGVTHSNLRQFVDKEIREQGIEISEIRDREVGLRDIRGLKSGKFDLKVTEYDSSSGKDYFIESCDENDTLIGFARLRFPSSYGYVNEIEEGTALIRELHVYGVTALVGTTGSAQHKGWGKKLVLKAEEIARANGFRKMAVISGVGVREYYEKLGYKLVGNYMIKEL